MTEYSKELVAPDGRVYVATSAREYNDLVYGGGYVDKPGDKPEVKSKSDSKTVDGARVKAAKADEAT